MKIILTNESIVADRWYGSRFSAKPQEITEVRVMADEATPKNIWDRLKRSFGGAKLGNTPRAIIIWAGEKAVSLDAYYDDGFDAAVEWFSRNGWDMKAAIESAIRTPLVRVIANRRDEPVNDQIKGDQIKGDGGN